MRILHGMMSAGRPSKQPAKRRAKRSAKRPAKLPSQLTDGFAGRRTGHLVFGQLSCSPLDPLFCRPLDRLFGCGILARRSACWPGILQAKKPISL